MFHGRMDFVWGLSSPYILTNSYLKPLSLTKILAAEHPPGTKNVSIWNNNQVKVGKKWHFYN